MQEPTSLENAILDSVKPPAPNPPAPAVPPGSAPPAGAPAGGGMDWMFNNVRPAPELTPEQGSQAPPPSSGPAPIDVPASSGAQNTPAGGPPTPEMIEAAINWLIPDRPEFLANGGAEKLENWREMRSNFKKVANERASLELLVSQIKAGSPAPAPGVEGQILPETEAVKSLQAKIAELEPAAKNWQTEQARRDISESVAFRQQFDAPRADILRELTAAAKKSGVTDPERAVQDFLKIETEFDRDEWISDNIEDDEGRVARFFASKGNEFARITAGRETELNTKDPISAVQDWQNYERAFQTKFGAKMAQDIQAQFEGAFPRVRAALLDEKEGDPVFFKTGAGAQALSDIAVRLSTGQGISPEEILIGLANNSRADAYQALAGRLAKQLAEIRESGRRNADLDPSRMAPPGGGYPGPSAPGSGYTPPANMPQIGVGRTEPLISREEMAKIPGLGG